MAEFVMLLREKYGKFDHVVVEELKVLKNQKVLVMLGIVQGLILRELRDSPVTFVAPTVWRKHFGLNGERKKAKQGALTLCEKLFVEVANDDEAESYLIALYFSTISLATKLSSAQYPNFVITSLSNFCKLSVSGLVILYSPSL